jgi:uncharacterized membrane protein YeiH
MFGKPQWFREKAVGWGLHPQAWQGWMYAAAWMAAIVVPFAGLVSRRQAPEALVWLAAAVGLLVWDVAGIRRSIRGSQVHDVLYIDEDGECCSSRV